MKRRNEKIIIVCVLLAVCVLLILASIPPAKSDEPLKFKFWTEHPDCPKVPQNIEEVKRWLALNPTRFVEAKPMPGQPITCVELIDRLQRKDGKPCRVAVRCIGI